MASILFCILVLKMLFQTVSPEGNALPGISGQRLEKESRNECDAVIRGQYGLIRSPGFPGKYPRYSRCQYTVYRFSPDSCELKLTLQRFEVAKMAFSNCSADFFEIQNGSNRSKLCGELPEGSKKFVFFPDSEDKLVFKFQSTFNQKPGFSIELKQLPFSCKKVANTTTTTTLSKMRVQPSCRHIITGRIGRIKFPNSSSQEQPLVNRCTYIIRRSEPRACVVQLDFSSFEVRESAGCETDYLRLPDGQKLCGILGGSRKLLQFTAGNEELNLDFVFTSDKYNNFDLQVAQLPGPCDYSASSSNLTDKSVHQCDQTISSSIGRITSPGYPFTFGPNYRCIYRIFRPDPSVCQMELNIRTFNLGKHNPPGCHSGAYLELPGKNRLCHDLNGKMILRISEFKDPVLFYFQSDSQTSGPGFDIQLRQAPNTCPGYDVHSEIPHTFKRCYQEVTSHNGHFSSIHLKFSFPMWCEFVIRRADPTVCIVKLQLSSKTFLNLPCINNFIHLPNGERMCVSVTERREVQIPKDSEYITMVYYNTNNAEFHIFVEQIRDSCKINDFQNYRTKSKRWD